MRNHHSKKYDPARPKGRGGIVFGAFVAIAGLGFLVRAIDNDLLPRFLFTWQFVLIILGLLTGIVNGFKGNGWWIMLLLGTFFTFFSEIEHIMRSFRLEIKRFIFPAFLITMGLIIFFRSRRKASGNYTYTPPEDPLDSPLQYQKEERDAAVPDNQEIPLLPPAGEISDQAGYTQQTGQDKRYQHHTDRSGSDDKATSQDFIELNAMLASNERIVMSKKFMGGKVNCIAGGAVLDLHHADFESVVAIDVFCIAGGVDIIIPSNWSVKNEATAVLGAVEDSRRNKNLNEPNKIVIIKGIVLMGGIEIKN